MGILLRRKENGETFFFSFLVLLKEVFEIYACHGVSVLFVSQGVVRK